MSKQDSDTRAMYQGMVPSLQFLCSLETGPGDSQACV